MRQIEVFLGQVTDGSWHGDQSVWIASDDPAAKTQWLPCAGDWMRAVQVANHRRARRHGAQICSRKGTPMIDPRLYDRARERIAEAVSHRPSRSRLPCC